MSQGNSIKRHAPLVNIAAIAVILASVTAIGAVTGLIPSALSYRAEIPAGQGSAPLAVAESAAQSSRGTSGAGEGCRQCGVIETIRQVHLKGQGTGLGAVAGGVTGAIVGSQFGRGNGRTAMGVVGAAGGAFAGHEIERNVRATSSYRVVVRMEDGSARTVYQSAAPAVGVGDKVRVINGALAARG